MPDTPQKPLTYFERLLAVARRVLARRRQDALGLRVVEGGGGSVQKCKCCTPPIDYRDYGPQQQLDADGFYTVSMETCRRCGATWLRVHYEDAHTASGRWWRGIVPPATAQAATVHTALDTLNGLPWHLVGGSFFNSTGSRCEHGTLRP